MPFILQNIFSALICGWTSAVNSTKKSSDLHTDTGMSEHSN